MMVPAPVIIIEVLSHELHDIKRDLTTKLAGYALVQSIEHYLVIDPEERTVLHFRRQGDLLKQISELTEGMLQLDPPGLARIMHQT